MRTAARLIIWWSCLLPLILAGQQSVEEPGGPRSISAHRAASEMTIDGIVAEAEWGSVPVSRGFRQIQPDQGEPTAFDTEVRVQYDDEAVYVAAFCRDTAGWSGVRVPDLRRDFDFFANDLFGVCFDPYGDRRLSIAFQTNPYGVQRDLQVLDGVEYDRNWDARWAVRTAMTDSGWSVEMAIPWSTLRYDAERSRWRVNFVRIVRRTNETSGWSVWPREFDPYAMAYAGDLDGLVVPPPSLNARIMPSFVARNADPATAPQRTTISGGVDGKWALTPNTVLDLTIKTDFAETDVDDPVISLSRFSVFFPEKRQFFLENQNLFSTGLEGMLQPFFSRSIGLDAAGNPVPIEAGVRITSRTSDESVGGLFIRQAGERPASFGVARYITHIGETGRIGVLSSMRRDDQTLALPATTNVVGAVDGYVRPLEHWSISGMLSISRTEGGNGNGTAGYAKVAYKPSWIYAFWQQVFISPAYAPSTGFISSSDIIQTFPGFYLDWRPEWRPSFIRSFEPGVYVYAYHRFSDRTLQQASVVLSPVWIGFDDGSNFALECEPTWHNFRELYAPLGAPLALGDAYYTRWRLIFNGDNSKTVSVRIRAATGTYFNGRLNAVTVGCAVAPVPHIAADIQYTVNDATGLGVERKNVTTHLVTPRLRLAVDPRLQMTTQFQYNSFVQSVRWNVRLSYEFSPLSYCHVVFNELLPEGEGSVIVPERKGTMKLTYQHQL
jgi:hypothetical protein